MIHDRKCPECGATFAPRYGCQVCCSDECKRARRKRQNCERSREEFTTRARREARATRKAMLARLAERDRAYEREYGHPCGAPRGRYQLVDAR